MNTFTIIVPIYDETTALSFSKAYFTKLGLEPLYVLDSKKHSRQTEVENLLGQKVAIYDNPGACIEAGYEQLASLSPTDWILRVDCDEVPNLNLIRHCTSFVAKPSDSYCGFDRDDLIWRDGHFERLKYAPLFFDTQFRLFNRRQVKFITKIHTPGFHIPVWKLPLGPWWHASLKARIYHLQRVLTQPANRFEKVQRYNAVGQDKKFDDWHKRQEDSFHWGSFGDQEFTKFFASWLKAQEAHNHVA